MRVFVIKGAGLAAVLLLTAGCGSASSGSATTAQPSTVRSDFGLVFNEFKQTSRSIGLAVKAPSSQTDAQIASRFKGLAAQWQSDVTKLKSLTPPPSVAAPYQALSAAADRTEADLKTIVLAAQNHSGSEAKQAGARLVSDILQARSAAQTISTKLGIR
jgi:hypothetical protein